VSHLAGCPGTQGLTLLIEYVEELVPASNLGKPDFDKSYVLKSKDGFINGSDGGNVSRYINHSCDPNLNLISPTT
jgi:hypothetical protein